MVVPLLEAYGHEVSFYKNVSFYTYWKPCLGARMYSRLLSFLDTAHKATS